MLLDRGGDPWIAKTAAALLHAARGIGEGYVLLVNDGSYSGEDGVLLRLVGGAVTSTPIPDCHVYADRFGPALFEEDALPTAEEVVALSASNPRRKKPAAKTAKRAATGAKRSSPKRT
jgi:hypothetical protein